MFGTAHGVGDMSDHDNAFEYVVGTLDGDERANFENALASDAKLRAAVNFWEEQLVGLHKPENKSPPESTWNAIEAAITSQARAEKLSVGRPWGIIASWLSTCAALLLCVVFFINSQNSKLVPLQPKYVAVLTNAEGGAVVTALSSKGEKSVLSLHWEAQSSTASAHLQMWAISKSDGQARPLATLENNTDTTLQLDKARWRLIADADYLIITVEDAEGSVKDKPSENVVAKGVCINLG